MKDSIKYALGLNYQLTDKFKIRTGTAYEEGSIKSSNSRSPRIPSGDVIWASLGFEYKIKDNMKIDFTYAHQFYNKTNSNTKAEPFGASINTNYKVSTDTFGIGLGVEF